MKIIKLTAIILLLITLPIGVFADEKKLGVIQLHSGPISGMVEEGVRFFLGIPYAAPPAHSRSSQLPANSARTASI